MPSSSLGSLPAASSPRPHSRRASPHFTPSPKHHNHLTNSPGSPTRRTATYVCAYAVAMRMPCHAACDVCDCHSCMHLCPSVCHARDPVGSAGVHVEPCHSVVGPSALSISVWEQGQCQERGLQRCLRYCLHRSQESCWQESLGGCPHQCPHSGGTISCPTYHIHATRSCTVSTPGARMTSKHL